MKNLFITSIFLFASSLFLLAQNTQVVFVQDDMSNDFRKAQVLAVQKHIQSLDGVDFRYTDAKGSLSLFIYQLEKAITKGVDIVLIGTPSASAITPALKKAKAKGVKTLIIDRGVTSNEYTAFIHSDNIEIGKIAGEYLAQKLHGKGTILLLEGLPKADVTQLRTQGFTQALRAYPNIKVIKRVANYLRKDAITVTEKLLNDKVDFDAVFSQSDSMLVGVRSVFNARGLDFSKKISIGCDYIAQAKKAILNGTQSASVKFPLAGKESVEIVRRLITNQPIPKRILIPIEIVTRDNASKIEPIFWKHSI